MFSLSDSIQISSFNTPLDTRTRVADLSKLTDGSIQMPYVGLPVWVTSEEKVYVVTGITGNQVTSYEILNSEDYFNYTSSTTYTDLSNNTKPVRKDGYVVEVDHDTSTSPYKYILQYIDGLGIHHKITVSQSGGANTDITNTIAEVYVYNGNYQGLYQAVQEGKVIIWNNNVATVEYLNNAFRLSVIDGDGVLHTLIISAGNLQLPTEDTKHFLKKEDYLYFGNDTTFLELKNRGQIPVKVDEHVAKVTDLGTSIKMEYLDGPVLTTVIKSSDESVSRSQVNILLSVEVDPSDNSFDIKNALGASVGSINFGSNSTTGIAELTFTDGTNTFSAPLPSIRYDSNTQLLKYTTDGGESWQDIIKMSNLQIKEVTEKELDDHLTDDLAFNTQTVDNKTYYIEQGADSTYTLGDLILASDGSTDYILWVCDQCDFDPSDETYTYHFVNVGSINNVSLVADQVEFDNSENGFEATDVQDAIEEVVKGHSVEHTSDYVNEGYLNSVGVIKTQGTNYKYTTPIQVSKGEIIAIETIAYISSEIALICKCQSDGTYIKTLLVGDGVGTGTKVYTYTVKEDCYVILSAYDANKTTFIYDRSGTNTIREDVDVLEEDIAELKEAATALTDVEINFSEYEEEKINIDQTGKWFIGNARYTGYLIPILPNRTYMLVGKDGVDANHQSKYALLKNIDNMVTGGTPAYVDGQSGYVKVVPNETKVVETPSDANYMWVSKLIPVIGEATNIDTLMESVTLRSTVQDIQNDIATNATNIETLSEQVATMDSELNGTVVVVSSDDFVNTGAIKDTGVIDAELTDYKYTDAIQVSKGDVIRMDIYATNRIGIVCACDENGTLGNVLKTGDYDVQQQVYTYTMLSDGYVRLCAFKVTTSYFKGVDITPQSVPSKVEEAMDDIEELQTKTGSPIAARIRLFPEGTANTSKLPCVCFQFDHVSDAARDGNRQIVELFESKGVKGGFGYVTGTIDGNNVVKEDTWLKKYGAEYLEYHKRGWDIINHGLHTAWLDSAHEEQQFWLDDTNAKYYIFRSKYLLEKWGFTVNGWITYNSAMRASLVDYVKLTHAYGATIATNTGEHISNTRNGSPCETVRIGMESKTLAQLKAALDTAITYNRICVFYCHTYEFGRTFPAADNEEFNLDKVEELLDYCIAKRDAGLVYLGSNDECYKYFYGL